MKDIQKRNHFKELHHLHEYCREITESYLRKYYINFGSYIILNCINDNPDITQYQIAKSTRFSTQRTNQLVKALEEQELIKKQVEKKHKKILLLTPKGEQVMIDTEQQLEDHFQRSLGIESEVLTTVVNAMKILNIQLR